MILRKFRIWLLRRLRCEYTDIRKHNGKFIPMCNIYNHHPCTAEECRLEELEDVRTEYNKIWKIKQNVV